MQVPLQVISIPASADLSSYQFRFVKVDGNGRAALAGVADHGVGVLQNKPEALDRAASVMTFGIAGVVAGGTISAGDRVRADSQGRAVTSAAGEPVLGVALEAAASAGAIVSVLLCTAGDNGIGAPVLLSIPIVLSNVADGDVVTEFPLNFDGEVVGVYFVVTDPVTTADKATDLNLEIETTNVTGGVVSLTSANCGTLGAVVAGTAITANNAFSDGDALSVEASSTTAFAEGQGVLVVQLRATST